MTSRYFTIEALPARKGDSLIIYEGASDNFNIAVIDGGPSKVYNESLRPRLNDIRREKDLDDNTPLPVDLMMVSHLDDDHIKGILDMSKELEEQKEDHQPLLLSVHNLWNNTFDNILGNDQGTLSNVLGADGVTASIETIDWSDVRLDHDDEAVLASIGQGYKLRNYSERLNWRVNGPFGEDALIMQRGTDDDFVRPFTDNVKFTVVGPLKPEIVNLQKKYDKYLRDKNLGRNEREAVVASMSQDKSITNLSSLVVLLECESKSILLTGDALGTKIIEGLEARGLLNPGGSIHVDVLKMQHHGSDRNVTPDFFKKVTADHYIFCGDGAHGNPERQAVEWLISARDGDEYMLHFTYQLEKIDKKRKEEVHDDHVWNHEQDSLQALLNASGDNVKINFPNDATGIRIDLADPIDF